MIVIIMVETSISILSTTYSLCSVSFSKDLNSTRDSDGRRRPCKVVLESSYPQEGFLDEYGKTADRG